MNNRNWKKKLRFLVDLLSVLKEFHFFLYVHQDSVVDRFPKKLKQILRKIPGADPENSGKGGRVPQPFPPG